MAAAHGGGGLQGPLLGETTGTASPQQRRSRRSKPWAALSIAAALLVVAGVLFFLSSGDAAAGAGRGSEGEAVVVGERRRGRSPHEVESEVGAAAADDARCSEVGAAALRAGGHAVDAAVAAALCLGVVHPMSSGLGGGAFVVVRDGASGEAVAFDARETAPAAATPDMYAADPSKKYKGALAMGIPGELAGLHAAWSRYGRLPWRDLVAPAIRLARDGYEIVAYVARALKSSEADVLADPGLRAVFAPAGRVLAAGETCRNPALAAALELIADEGSAALYGGAVGAALVRDVTAAGGIVTVEDLRNYRVEVSDAMRVDSMGFTFLGMPPPSSGTVGMAMILNVLGGYKSLEFLKGFLGIHRLIEAIKHMLATRMDLGDPDFVNVTGDVAEMLSLPFADRIRGRIVDNTTFPAGYYFPKWRQLDDHGTSHLCVVDGDRNVVAMTTTVNYYFGAKVLSPSTGIVLNNEMDDFSVPAKRTPDHLPPAPANFIAPGKRPLSSMTPLIILKDGQLAGVVGGSGGTNIIATVTQVFLNHFVVGMDPLAAVQQPRVYHKLIPNVVTYEDETVADGEVIALSAEAKEFLEQRGHWLVSTASGAVCQFIVHEVAEPAAAGGGVVRGMLTAVSDPRKDGRPAGL
ncbi:hypothetical protein HU200_031236 [Digitaria exilis]|uniref:Glutathione hydrolase n=1 Tax=Digitaria exilis TaxID=1010633 RepID=A0A835EQF0_9POAL|nr:hypothetical protein HU200_031236 [Digitaria exilis]